MAAERRVAVVTGGARGIGLETARQLVAGGLRVVLTARERERAETAARSLGDATTAIGRSLDVTDSHSVDSLARFVGAELGRVDVLVNNAGVALDKWVPALSLDVQRLRATLETNFVGAFACSQALVPLMKQRNYGRIVNMSSQLGSLARMGGFTLAYRASKVALNALTRALAAELEEWNILVNSVCPGWVRTGLGGDDAPRTAAEAATGVVWLATLADDGPRGGFFQDGAPLPW
jgi:NAD(P)-dependent dehydrogenase (short-subunit alcohol dehydrogenase family)